MSQKLIHFDSVHIECNIHSMEDEENVKIEIYKPLNFVRELLTIFWVPLDALKKVGENTFVPLDIIRLKCRSIGLTFDDNTSFYK